MFLHFCSSIRAIKYQPGHTAYFTEMRRVLKIFGRIQLTQTEQVLTDIFPLSLGNDVALQNLNQFLQLDVDGRRKLVFSPSLFHIIIFLLF